MLTLHQGTLTLFLLGEIFEVLIYGSHSGNHY